MSIDLVPLLAADWTESDKHIKLIGLMTITMKKNNSDQTKGKPWTESVNPLNAQINPECVPRLPLKICIIYWLEVNCKHDDHFSDIE